MWSSKLLLGRPCKDPGQADPITNAQRLRRHIVPTKLTAPADPVALAVGLPISLSWLATRYDTRITDATISRIAGMSRWAVRIVQA